MAGLDAIELSADELELLSLSFALGQELGETSLSISSASAYDADVEAIALSWSNGILAVGCEKGNVFKDSEINSADAILTLQIAVGLHEPNAEEACAADMNSDGVVDVGDAILILRRAVGLDKAGLVASSESAPKGREGNNPLPDGGQPARVELADGGESGVAELRVDGAAGIKNDSLERHGHRCNGEEHQQPQNPLCLEDWKG